MHPLLSLGSLPLVVLLVFVYGFPRIPGFVSEVDSYIASILATAGSLSYARGDYEYADDLYARAQAFATSSDTLATIAYDRGNIAYRQNNHTGALVQYHTALSGTGEVVYRSHHATGNSLYRIGEYNSSKEILWQIIFWTEAVKGYERALSVHDDPETRANRDYVLEKLKRLSQSNPQKDDDTRSSSSGQSSTGSENSQKSDSTSAAGKWTNTGSYKSVGSNGNGNGSDTGTGLSWSDRQALEEYSRDMIRFEQKNGRYFHRNGKSPGVSDPFGDFFGVDRLFSSGASVRERDW